MNCLGVFNFNCLCFDLPFGRALSAEEKAVSLLYKDKAFSSKNIEVVQIDEGIRGGLHLVAISIVNIFSLVVFGSRKWEFVLSGNSLDPSKSIYINTWSFTEDVKAQFCEFKKSFSAKNTAREAEKSFYVSHKSGFVDSSCYFTEKYIFEHIKTDKKSLDGGASKKCKKVRDQADGRTVARLSLLLKDRDKEDGLARLGKEIRFLERLKGCPFVVQMLAADEGRVNSKGEKKMAIYLNFYDKGDLFNYLAAHSNLDFPVKIKIAGELIQGLKEIHDRGIVHNDIKLENILLRVDEKGLIEPGICDFDLAWDKTNINELIPGTPTYASPEKIYMALHLECPRNFEEFKRADVWSLGLVLRRLFLGSMPDWFDEQGGKTESVVSMLNKKHGCLGSFFNEPEDLHSVEHLIWEMVQYDVSKRPTMGQVAERWAQLYTSYTNYQK